MYSGLLLGNATLKIGINKNKIASLPHALDEKKLNNFLNESKSKNKVKYHKINFLVRKITRKRYRKIINLQSIICPF